MKSLVKSSAIALTAVLLLSGTPGSSANAKDKTQKCGTTHVSKKVAGKKGAAKQAAKSQKACKVKKDKKAKKGKKNK